MRHRRNVYGSGGRRQSPLGLLVAAALVLAACGPSERDDATAGAEDRAPGAGADRDAPIALGVDVLLRDSLALVQGRRVGLITNHTGLGGFTGPDREMVSTIDLLDARPEFELVALFSPEHGLQGRAEAGEAVASGQDPATGLPIHSLYSTDRRPTPEMLEGIDVLLFDIQDVGARYYTYVWTMALAMEAAGEAGIEFIVLDRPNPIGGRLVQGNVLDPEFATFVGLYPVPMRHGLTAGELARLLVGEHDIDVRLRVVPTAGWTRDTWYDDTGLPFIAPSPNMPSLASATHYPGSCLFEGTNLSVGRGTDRAFQQIGAPWLDADAIATRLNDLDGTLLSGVRFEPVTFTPRDPGDGKFGGQEVPGLRWVATDRERYDPTVAAVAVLVEIQRAHADRLEWRVSHFDRLAGTDRLRLAVLAGANAAEITAPWAEEVRAFEERRRQYLLYE